MITKQEIVQLLAENDKAVARALIVLNERQTTDEQRTQATRVHNGRGFKPCHARMGTSMAQFYQRNKYLSPKQLAYWRKLDKRGTMRIACYWAQLLEVAQAKAKQVLDDEIAMKRAEAEDERQRDLEDEYRRAEARKIMEQ
jgi:hypothetical protein